MGSCCSKCGTYFLKHNEKNGANTGNTPTTNTPTCHKMETVSSLNGKTKEATRDEIQPLLSEELESSSLPPPIPKSLPPTVTQEEEEEKLTRAKFFESMTKAQPGPTGIFTLKRSGEGLSFLEESSLSNYVSQVVGSIESSDKSFNSLNYKTHSETTKNNEESSKTNDESTKANTDESTKANTDESTKANTDESTKANTDESTKVNTTTLNSIRDDYETEESLETTIKTNDNTYTTFELSNEERLSIMPEIERVMIENEEKEKVQMKYNLSKDKQKEVEEKDETNDKIKKKSSSPSSSSSSSLSSSPSSSTHHHHHPPTLSSSSSSCKNEEDEEQVLPKNHQETKSKKN